MSNTPSQHPQNVPAVGPVVNHPFEHTGVYPAGTRVYLKGDFDAWQSPYSTKQQGDTYTATVPVPSGKTYEYKFQITLPNGTVTWEPNGAGNNLRVHVPVPVAPTLNVDTSSATPSVQRNTMRNMIFGLLGAIGAAGGGVYLVHERGMAEGARRAAQLERSKDQMAAETAERQRPLSQITFRARVQRVGSNIEIHLPGQASPTNFTIDRCGVPHRASIQPLTDGKEIGQGIIEQDFLVTVASHNGISAVYRIYGLKAETTPNTEPITAILEKVN